MIIKKLIILNPVLEEANLFEFSNKANIICSDDISGNHAGKSSLLKSLYYTLGLGIKTFPENWNYYDMMFKIYYSHDNKDGYIIRYKDNFYLSNNEKILNYKDYSLWLSDLLKIQLKLTHFKTDENATLRTSVYTFPYYIDQDKSWGGIFYKHLNSMNHYSNVPKRPIEYLLGIYNDNLNILETKKKDLQNKIQILRTQKSSLENLKDNFIKEKNYELIFDEDKIKSEIKEYLSLAEKLSDKISDYKIKIYDERKKLDTLRIEQKELGKLLRDNQENYNTIKLCQCPVCESELTIEQSVKRIKLKYTEFNIKRYQLDTQNNIDTLISKIDKLKKEKINFEKEYQSLLKISTIKSEKLTLKQYIDEKANEYSAENYNNIVSLLTKQIKKLDEDIISLGKEINKTKKTLEEKRKAIKEQFDILRNSLNKAFPHSNIISKEFLDFAELTKSSGAGNNQTVLSLYLIYFSLLIEYSNIEFPFGIDAITKDEVDITGMQTMYEQLNKHLLSKNCQSFAVVLKDKLKYIQSKQYKIIELSNPILSKEKFNVLQEEFLNILD